MAVLHLDIESFSDCDLKTEGLYRYAADPSTDLLVVCYAFDDGSVQTWIPGQPLPEALRRHIQSGGQVRAHNAAFERVVLNGPAGQRYGFPRLKIEQMVCTMAKMAAHGLPHALENAADALGTHPKNAAGANDMRYLCKRRADGTRPTPADEPERFLRLYAYCVDDVEAERGIDRVVPDLSPNEQKVWELDQRMNDRGWKVDLESIGNAQFLIDQYKAELSSECKRLTGLSISQTGKLADWCRDNGYLQLTDLQVGTVNAAVADPDCPTIVKKVLSLFSTHNMKAVTKYASMARAAGADSRLRGMFVYHGANCVPGATEVLTRDGWRRLDAWQGGDIAQVREDLSIEFLPASRFEGPVTQDWLALNAPYVKCAFTRGHTFPTLSHRIRKWTTRSAADVAAASEVRVPISGTLQTSGALTPEQMRVLVMTQADGSFETQASVGCRLALQLKKPRKIARARQLLAAAGVTFDEATFPSKPEYVRFTVRARNYPVWLSAERKLFGAWLLDSTPAAREAFIDELLHWDGYDNAGCTSYCSVVRENVEWVCTIAHLTGMSAAISEKAPVGPRQVLYQTTIRKRDWCLAEKRDWLPAPPQKAFCAVTRTGYWLARHQGLIFVTGNTGRWASRIAQLHNLYRPVIDDPGTAVAAFGARDLPWIKALYGDVGPMKVLASCIRSMLIAEEGKDLMFLDYSGIEARGNAWLWDEYWKLDAFRAYDAKRGPNVYKLAYAKLFSVPVEDVTDAQQQVGKVIDLASGYGGGVNALVNMAKTYHLDLRELTKFAYATLPAEVREEAHSAWAWAIEQKRTLGLDQQTYVVLDAFKRLWRATHPGISTGWKHLETAMVTAITSPGQVVAVANKRLMFKVEGDFLYMRLPSGRKLAYYKPRYDETTGVVSYVDSATRRRTDTYGGRADENATQGLCRDVLARAKQRLEPRGYLPVGSVHDEPILEVPAEFGSLDEAAEIMCAEEKWARGLPLAVKGHRAKRYRK